MKKMSRFNSVPAIIQQIAEALSDSRTTQNEKFNRAQVLEVTREFCEQALAAWKKEQDKKRR
jgi:hypothetical protein